MTLASTLAWEPAMRVLPKVMPIPDDVAAWADDWAEINMDMSEEGSFLSKHGPDILLPAPINLYGGAAPVGAHVDTTFGENEARFMIWGLVLTSPEGELVANPGTPDEIRAPLSRGTVYALDPSVEHEVVCPRGHIAFAATWGVDPVEAFGSMEEFGILAMCLAAREQRHCPDGVRFVERALGMKEGELS